MTKKKAVVPEVVVKTEQVAAKAEQVAVKTERVAVGSCPAPTDITGTNTNSVKTKDLKTETLVLTKEEQRKKRLERTLKALEELRDPDLNPFAPLKEIVDKNRLSPYSTAEQLKAKEERRKEALKKTIAALEEIRDEEMSKRSFFSKKNKSSSSNKNVAPSHFEIVKATDKRGKKNKRKGRKR